MAEKDIPVNKVIQVLTKPVEVDTISVGNDAHLYRSVEKALGADVRELSEQYGVALSKKVVGEVSEEFFREVEQKALDYGRAYTIRRIIGKRKQLLDRAFEVAMEDPKGHGVLLRLLDILIGNTNSNSKITKKITTERKVRFEDIAKPPADKHINNRSDDYIETDYTTEEE